MDHYDEFKSLWAAHFKRLTEPDGLQEYLEFVAKSDYNLVTYAVSILSDQYQAKKKENERTAYPNLGALKSCYFDLKKMDQGPGINRGNCGACKNAGYVPIVKYRDRILNPRKPEPLPAIELNEWAASCTCGYGDHGQPQKVKNENVLNSFGPYSGGNVNPLDLVREYKKSCQALYEAQQLESSQAAQAVTGG